jgi:hypothetical protein
MKARNYLLLFYFFAAMVTRANATCNDYQRIYGTLDLQKKEWKTLRINETKEKICDRLPEVPNANLEIKLTNKEKKFSTKIFRTLVNHWDHPEKNGQWSGGIAPLHEVEINVLIPHWYKDATLTIFDQHGKKLSESKL